jgi:hypothetical protein
MAIDQRKRQKQLAKQRAKRKAKQAQDRQTKQGSPRNRKLVLSVAEMEKGMAWPVDECYVTKSIFSRGMGTVIVSRNSGNGRYLLGIYLIDAYCLGVKDAFMRYLPEDIYRNFLIETDSKQGLKKVDAAYAKKLIEDAVAYARNLGLEPHPDYILSRHLLSDIDSSPCKEKFTFGFEGKPLFMPGPYDSEARIRQIMKALGDKVVAGEAHYMIPITPDSLFGDDEDDEDDDFEDDEDDDFEDDEEDFDDREK